MLPVTEKGSHANPPASVLLLISGHGRPCRLLAGESDWSGHQSWSPERQLVSGRGDCGEGSAVPVGPLVAELAGKAGQSMQRQSKG